MEKLTEEPMLDWIGEKIFAIVTFVPALFVDEKSPNFMLIRAMFGLLLIVLIVYILAMRPVRTAIARWMGRRPTQ
jgi:high-affinity Fe2+/Pb2+ permease